MSTQERIKASFVALVADGKRIITKSGSNGREYAQNPPENDYFRFRTEALNLVRRSCGETSDHYRELRRLAEAKESSTNSYFLVHCFGVVEAAQRDFDSGALFDMKALVSAEVLGDFIEQAEVLLAAEYIVPAASLAGAILEDTLRKLCEKHAVPFPDKTKIDRLNADLAKAGVYDKLIQKRITAIADIRNNADHGHPDKFTKVDVDDMVKWVRNFAADFLK